MGGWAAGWGDWGWVGNGRWRRVLPCNATPLAQQPALHACPRRGLPTEGERCKLLMLTLARPELTQDEITFKKGERLAGVGPLVCVSQGPGGNWAGWPPPW